MSALIAPSVPEGGLRTFKCRWEFAGVVDAVGPGVDWAVGTRVAGLVAGFDRDYGTYVEQIVVPAADVAPVPDGLDLLAATTVPLNGLAAAQVVDLLGDAPAGAGRLLVIGAAGGGRGERHRPRPGTRLAGDRARPRRRRGVRPRPRRRLHRTRRAGMGRSRRPRTTQ
ncbi:alcohol dehydrogenase catalytic domain-containing protein [Streptomyces sp. NPDC059679]|uniref:alcohol dehydrogenase catalytic domain-containing protein n=1 Tax=Streptomyces sp. NPDC059679 TaxID=3346903 RepID=UPI0036C76D15